MINEPEKPTRLAAAEYQVVAICEIDCPQRATWKGQVYGNTGKVPEEGPTAGTKHRAYSSPTEAEGSDMRPN